MSPKHKQKAKEYVEKILRKGFIRPSKAEASYLLFFVLKGLDDERLVVDYRPLNDITEKDNYPIRLIEDIIDCIQGYK